MILLMSKEYDGII